MTALFFALRLLAAALSFGGYGWFLHRRFELRAEFLPVTVFASASCALFLAGILNMLAAAVWILFFGGLILLAVELLRRRPTKAELRELLPFGVVLFAVGCAWAILFLRDAHLYAYDDFSHWGAIVKELQRNNQLPSFASQIVTFPDYPPGSALFVYYVTKLLGPGENRMLMAQLILTLSCVVTPFAFAGRGRRAVLPCLAATAGGLLMLACFPQALSTLLVDSLLPLMALANTAVLLFYRDRMRTACLLSIPLMAMTILIKNSGMFFVGLNLLLLLGLAVRCRRKRQLPGRQILRYSLIGLLLPLCLLVVWKQHVRLVFPEEELRGHHTVSVENYAQNYTEKTPEQLAQIRAQFLERATDFGVRYNHFMLLMTEAAAVLYLVFRLLLKRRLTWLLLSTIAADAAYLLYLLGIYLTYLFSMPAAEASSLEAFRRYALTMVIYAIGVVLIGALIDTERLWGYVGTVRWGGAGAAVLPGTILLVFCYCMLLIKGWEPFLSRPAYETTRPYPLDRALEQVVDARPGDSYLIYLPGSDRDAKYSWYLVRYKLFGEEFELASSFESRTELEEKRAEYNHFVIVKEDEALSQLIR